MKIYFCFAIYIFLLVANCLFPAALSAQHSKLLDFNGANGKNPYHCTFISDGTFLYGMTTYGGTNDKGTIFKIKPDGTGDTVLFNFAGTSNGSYPYGSLFSDGTFLYGMTQYGGTNLSGTIFKIMPDGTNFTQLFEFNDTISGKSPFGSLISDGTFLYGMTTEGGTSTGCAGFGCGTIFKIMPDGTGYSKLHDFQGVTDGSYPYGSLVSDGTFLYGMTRSGGSASGGTIFKIKPDGTAYSKFFDFQNTSSVSNPYGSLIYDGTFLYGMTEGGGTSGFGTIFKIKPDGTGYSQLFGFFGSNGSGPYGSLISDGTFLYGMTSSGGANNDGALFKIKTDGTNYSILFDFDETANGGVAPYGSLFSDGTTLWGMTRGGGNYGYGTIFKFYIPCALPSAPAICAVTVDSLSQYNVIYWDKSPYIGSKVDSFIVHREVQSNVYMPLGAVSINELSMFVDTFRTKYFISPYFNLGDPNAGTYRYKLQVRDTCANYSTLSPFHNTIFMTNNSGTFSWPQLYTIEGSSNPVTSYLLLRDDLNNGNWNVVNSVAGTQQSVSDPQYATWQSTANWRIETQWNISCTPTRNDTTINSAKSNTFKTSGTGINEGSMENLVSVYPNPTNGKFVIKNEKFVIKTLEIYNLHGEKSHSIPINNYSAIIDLIIPNGIYFLKIISNKETINKKIIVTR